MIRGFWVPTNWKRAVLLLAIVVMVVLRQSELVGLMDSTTLLFGWLPAQLAFDIGIGLAAVAVTYGMYVEAPDPPAEFEPTVEPDRSDVEERASAGGD